jgi:hypothetical protein
MDLIVKFPMEDLDPLFNRWQDAFHLLADYFFRFGLGRADSAYCYPHLS